MWRNSINDTSCSVILQKIPTQASLSIPPPGVRVPVTVEDGGDCVVRPVEALDAGGLLGQLEVVLGYLPLVILLPPDLVQLLLYDDLVMVPETKVSVTEGSIIGSYKASNFKY